MSSKNLSSEVSFISDPAHVGAPESFFNETSALESPRLVGLMRRASELREAGVITSGEIAGARRTGTIEELVLGKSNLLPAWFLEVGARRASAVCKIETSGVDYKGRPGSWAGTGFLISPNVLLTNHHVLNSTDTAGRARCVFNFQNDEVGKAQQTRSFRANPQRLFITSPTPGGLDFTFVWVDGEPGKQFGFVPVDRKFFKVLDGEFTNIIQHPNGEPKQVTIQDNLVVSQRDTVVHYTSDTMPGSSGSPAFNNQWKAVALHHASAPNDAPGAGGNDSQFVNEGIKFSAIAAFLERLRVEQPAQRPFVDMVLPLIGGTDEMMGFFGGLGREASSNTDGNELVVKTYKGEDDDIDVGFWNIEWFNLHYEEKMAAVAEVIVSMNLDVWAFEETSPEATAALAEYLRDNYEINFDWAASEPDASGQKQTTTVMWNTKTVKGERREWPEELDKNFYAHSDDFPGLGLERAENGPIFPRYPGLFNFRAGRGAHKPPLDFFLVPLHLKAMGEGWKRRRMAAAILAFVVNKMINDYGEDADWIVGGDYNATLASQDFASMITGGMTPLSAEDEQGGSFSYVKGPKSLIDHIFLSANLSKQYGSGDFFIVAKDKTVSGYTDKISDHRPILVRLSLNPQPAPHDERTTRPGISPALLAALESAGAIRHRRSNGL